jgi:hypothetical protein
MTASKLGLAAFLVLAAALPLACAKNEPAAVSPPRAMASTASSAPPPAPATSGAERPVTAPPTVSLPPTPVSRSVVATAKTDPSWATCHRSDNSQGDDVAKGVTAIAHACEAATKMKQVGKTMLAKQGAEDPPQSFPLEAKANHCYRAYAKGTREIKDLDLGIKDSAGVLLGQDSTEDAAPIVLRDGAVCFQRDDQASVVVSVGMGRGAYALQVWSD